MTFEKIFCLLTVIFLITKSSIAVSIHTTSKIPKVQAKAIACPNSPCIYFSPEQVVVGLWGLVGKISPLVNGLKNIIMSRLHICTKREFALLMAETLWTVDKFTGFNPETTPILTVYDSLINQTIATNNGGDTEQLYEAIDTYGKLCQSAIDFAIHVGLQAAYCPTKNPHSTGKKVARPPSCGKECVKIFFESVSTEISEELKDAIIQLSESPSIVDQTVAAGCVAAATPSSVDLFELLIQRDELLKVLQLKACNFKIPPECCSAREKEMQQQCQHLSKATIETISTLTNNHPTSEEQDIKYYDSYTHHWIITHA